MINKYPHKELKINKKSIYIKDCSYLITIINWKIVESLIIENCLNLKFIRANLNHIRKLKISKCYNLRTLERIVHKVVHIIKYENLESLYLDIFTNELNEVNIRYCNKLTSLYLSCEQLKYLTIYDCKNLHNADLSNSKDIIKYISILRITRWYRWQKRLYIFWKIAKYYMMRKYHPMHILTYIDLN